MKITLQKLHERRSREWRYRLAAGLSLALAYSAVVIGPFTLLGS